MMRVPGIYDISNDDADADVYVWQLRFDDGTWCDIIENGIITREYGMRCDTTQICSNNFFRQRNILWKSTKIKTIFLAITTRGKQRGKQGTLGLSENSLCSKITKTLVEFCRTTLLSLFSLRETEVRRPNWLRRSIARSSARILHSPLFFTGSCESRSLQRFQS